MLRSGMGFIFCLFFQLSVLADTQQNKIFMALDNFHQAASH
jgi:hypothetical protein